MRHEAILVQALNGTTLEKMEEGIGFYIAKQGDLTLVVSENCQDFPYPTLMLIWKFVKNAHSPL